jgi:hypothetical protein
MESPDRFYRKKVAQPSLEQMLSPAKEITSPYIAHTRSSPKIQTDLGHFHDFSANTTARLILHMTQVPHRRCETRENLLVRRFSEFGVKGEPAWIQ